jgi:hypothetical protein
MSLFLVHWACISEKTPTFALLGGIAKKNFEIFSSSFEFSKYLIHFWSASKVVDSSLLRQLSMDFF